MDNNLVTTPPPVTPPLPPPEPPVTIAQPTQFKSSYLISLVFLLTLAISSYFAYPYLSKYFPKAPNLFPTPTPASTPASTPLQAYSPIENSQNRLVYVRDPSPNIADDYQAWLIDPKNGTEEQLPLKNFTQAYKYYGSSKLFYRPVGDEGEYRVLDLSTGQEQSYKLISHPDPSAKESVTIDNFTEISPDGSQLVFMADFYTVCPSPSPFPSGFEGGFGPCQPGESIDTPFGYYLYDLTQRKATYLGNQIRVSRWDTQAHKLYYVDYGQGNTTKVLDLQTKLVTTIDSTSDFGYFTYPLPSSSLLAKQEGATGTSGSPAFSKITLLNLITQKSEDIDSENDWAAIQPFFTASPDDQNLIYLRTNLVGNGIRRSDLYLYSLADKKTSRLTPEDNTVSYRIYGSWIDSHTFVTSVDTIEETNYTNANNYLVKIDLATGQLTRLTPHDKVYNFNTQ